MWLIWHERNQRAFEDIERHTVELKLIFIWTLMDWMAAGSSQVYPSIISFIDMCLESVSFLVYLLCTSLFGINKVSYYLSKKNTSLCKSWGLNSDILQSASPKMQWSFVVCCHNELVCWLLLIFIVWFILLCFLLCWDFRVVRSWSCCLLLGFGFRPCWPHLYLFLFFFFFDK